MVSDRSNGIYRGIVVAIVGLILSTCPLSAQKASDARSSQPGTEQSGQISQGTPPPRVAAIDRIADELAETRKDQSDPYGDERNQREKRDIVAQESSAYWAQVNFWAIVVQTLLAAGALIAIILDLRQNRLSAERQLRAYIEYDAIEVTWPIGEKIDAIIRLKNSGQTPAYKLIVCGRIWAEMTESQISGSEADFTNCIPATVGSQNHMSTIMKSDQAITPEQSKFLESGKWQLHVVCFAHYRDVFGKRRDLAITMKTKLIGSELSFRPTQYGENYST